MTIKNLAVLYLRVSTEEQARENYSLDSQERICRSFCAERGWEVVTVFKDEGISAFKDVERPGFQQMIAYVEAHKGINLVFYDYSRFGRHTERALRDFRLLDKLRCFSIAATNPGIDCRTPAGRTARRDELSRAEDFSDRNSANTAARMEAARQDGRCTREAPVGYVNVKKAEHGQTNIVPSESAPLVSKAFDLMATGHYRAAEVLQIVTGLGLRSNRGNKMTLNSFFRMLRNETYIGMLPSQKYGTSVKGLHAPIVSEQTFRNVQLILKGRKPVAAPYKRNHPDYPLRGLLHCSECATALTAQAPKSKTGKRYQYYWCRKCFKVKSTSASKIEAQFISVLNRLRPNPETLSKDTLEREWKSRTADNAAIVRTLTAELKEKRAMQEKLVMAYLKGDKNVLTVYEQMSRKFEEDVALLQSQIADAETENATFGQLWEFAQNLLVDISTAWEHADINQKQRVQNILFPSGLKYHPENGILNSDNDSLFSYLEGFVAGKISLASPTGFEPVLPP